MAVLKELRREPQKEKTDLSHTLMLYVHVPFCVQKCRYCDFLSFPCSSEALKEDYTEAVIREIEYYGGKTSKDVSSVFLGGGTPTMLDASMLQRILRAITDHFEVTEDAEITIEMNPGTVTEEKAAALKTAGINRVSMGVQSFNDALLRILGRIHTATEAKESFRILRNAGFDNISLDLMSALPNQTMADWKETLSRAVELKPEHLSCYSLIIEENTPFYEQKETLALPDEITEREMYHYTNHFLEENGYERYEISNYAQKGKESRHNSGYWRRREYIGLGLGASSLFNNTRFSNTTDLKQYIEESPDRHAQNKEVLSIYDRMEEFMFLGLRMKEGIRFDDFEKSFGQSVAEAYKENYEKAVLTPINEGLLQSRNGRLFLTEKGVDLSNQVFVEFLF